jgi:ATP-binding protein involved in chromosome partitioning
VAATLSQRLGYDIPLLGEVPLDERLRSGGDNGRPLVMADPETPAAQVLARIAERLGGKPRGLLGRQLGLSPVGR